MTIKTQRRVVPKQLGTYHLSNGSSGNLSCYDFDVSQVTTFNHPGPPYKSGGVFECRRSTVVYTPSRRVRLFYPSSDPTVYSEYDTKWVPTGINSVPTHQYMLDGTVGISYFAPYGPTAYARFKPGQPTGSVGQFLGESHEWPRMLRNLPRLLHGRLKRFSDLGKRYLEVMFGWVPFVNDLLGMVETQRSLEKNLAQLVRDNGKGIRREGTLFETTTKAETLQVGYGYVSPVTVTAFHGPSSSQRRVRATTTTEKVWFSGRFRYWIPDVGTVAWRRRAIRTLYGGDLTPKLVWDLVPWSWLVDWFTNVGDVIDNVSENAASNLTADYAYLMGSRISVRETTWTGLLRDPDTGRLEPVSCSATETASSKTRAAASPYGFGVTLSSLSGRQLAILGALGISRTRF